MYIHTHYVKDLGTLTGHNTVKRQKREIGLRCDHEERRMEDVSRNLLKLDRAFGFKLPNGQSKFFKLNNTGYVEEKTKHVIVPQDKTKKPVIPI